MTDRREPEVEAAPSPVRVTLLQVEAARVAVKANARLGLPSSPGLIKIAEAGSAT